ncbi:BCCT family transporter [Alkalibaculum sp. M08DMB]|uniref:BCCT family transporter n=1 Tax=Alkalibaculum sporogenes TaxID=2655001 RepID=A0A6A7KCP8_9FIRM|nr:BCCT family transporter [Alkalibaculum sporogenes]MPW27081.1 BCCT family transporter [Alkalibaculum sporogenes]
MVLYISIAISIIFVIWGIFYSDSLGKVSNILLDKIIDQFGWFYLITALVILLFAVFLAFSKFGRIRLGKDNERPEYSTFTWFSMLFSAGMGIGLVFWGVAEPIFHYAQPPIGISPESTESTIMAMRYSFFHWGFHPWAMYAIVGMSLAYVTFRQNRPCTISSTLYPLIGEKANGSFGKFVDIMAILVTIFGVATSLGMGALQVNGGLSYLFKIPNNTMSQIIIIVLITLLFILSATSGINKGIKLLSNTNVAIASVIMMVILFIGPTAFILDTFTLSLGGYLQNIIEMSLKTTPITKDPWLGAWTLTYWAWWIAWSPFVGTFIARISRGRTIREFVLGVLVVPSIFSFIWFSVLGGTALHFEIVEGFNIASEILKDVSTGLFVTLSFLPLGYIISIIIIVLIVTFFITSADSSTFVLAMFSSKGILNPKTNIKIVWGIVQSLIAIVLLLSGGLQAIKGISIIMALPFVFIMILMCISLYKAVNKEIKEHK